MKGRKMGNDLSKRWIVITAAMLLTGCPIHQSADFASEFYKTDRMRICTKHSSNIDSGVMALSSPESYDTIILNKQTSTSSCANFFNEKNSITALSAPNTKKTNMKPYKVYNFSTYFNTKEGKISESSGMGPAICFTKDKNQQYDIHILKWTSSSYRKQIEEIGCTQ